MAKVVGIVGAEAAKFTDYGEAQAKVIIWNLLTEGVKLSSGHCHLGGIDIWAEEIAAITGGLDPSLIFVPMTLHWKDGYEPRNKQIAEASDEVHNIVVDRYPPKFSGMRFPCCYHCVKLERKKVHPFVPHVKSGGCWTAWYAEEKLGKKSYWHIVSNYEGVN